MSAPESKGKRSTRSKKPSRKKGTKYTVDSGPLKSLQAVNSVVTGTSAVQVKETRKGHISVYVEENAIDDNGNVRTPTQSPKNRHKVSSRASPKTSKKVDGRAAGTFDSPRSTNSPDSAFFSGDDTDIPPNMVKNKAQISKTYNYSYSRSGKVKENPNKRASLREVNKRFEEQLVVKPDSAMDL